MKTLITERLAANALLIILALVVGFHLLILLRVVPFEIVWGGRLKTEDQMLKFETVSIGLNLLMLAVVALKSGRLKLGIKPGVVHAILWMMFGLFLMNTLGNLFSNNQFEQLVFTPLTLLLAIFSWRLAVGTAEEAAGA
jgi:hypothetical protein